MLISCENHESVSPFKIIQSNIFNKYFISKTTLDISGDVKYVIYPTEKDTLIVEEFENSEILNPEPKTIYKDCGLITKLQNKYSLIHFEYFEFDKTGNIKQIGKSPCGSSDVETFIYEKGNLMQTSTYSGNSELEMLTNFEYNRNNLLTIITSIDFSKNDTTITEYKYTDNFCVYSSSYNIHRNSSYKARVYKIDKQNNNIELSPNLKYSYNKDSLVMKIENTMYGNSTSIFYDSYNNKIREISYDTISNIREIETYYYDSDNILIEKIEESNSDINITKFRKDGRPKDEFSYEIEEGEFHRYNRYEQINANGDIEMVSIVRRGRNGELFEKLLLYKYEYDNRGNWIKRKSYKNSILQNSYNRIIEYH